MKKALLAMLAVILLACPALAKTYVVSVNQIVEHPALDAVRQGFFDVLKEKGLQVEQKVHIAQGNISTANLIAKQIKGEKPDLILGIATPTAQAVAQAIRDVPILFSAVTDPLSAGLVKDMNKPGANISGMSDASPVDRQVALIKDFIPKVKKVGIIYNSGEANSVSTLKSLKAECAKLGLTVEEATVANSSGVYQAAKSLVGRCDAVYIPTDNTVVSAFESVVKACAENKLPLFAADVDSVPRGAVAAVAIDYYRHGRQTGEMAYRILKEGAKPADMPVEFLRDLKLYVNPKAAAQMGVTIPDAVRKKADKVID